MRRGFGFAVLVLMLLVGVGVGITAYNAGVSHGLSEAAEGGQIVRVVGPGFGFFPFGLFLFPLFFFLILGIGRRAAFGHRGWGGPGHHGDWKEGRERFEERAREWHEREHEPKAENAPPTATI